MLLVAVNFFCLVVRVLLATPRFRREIKVFAGTTKDRLSIPKSSI